MGMSVSDVPVTIAWIYLETAINVTLLTDAIHPYKTHLVIHGVDDPIVALPQAVTIPPDQALGSTLTSSHAWNPVACFTASRRSLASRRSSIFVPEGRLDDGVLSQPQSLADLVEGFEKIGWECGDEPSGLHRRPLFCEAVRSCPADAWRVIACLNWRSTAARQSR
jgi:hypothetical protein